MLTIKQTEPTQLIIDGLSEAESIAFLTPIKNWRDGEPEEPLVISPPSGATVHLYDADGTNHKMALSVDFLYHKPVELKLSYIPTD